MGNSVSAHIYETKVFRPYPVILYDQMEKNWCPHLKSMGNSVSGL